MSKDETLQKHEVCQVAVSNNKASLSFEDLEYAPESSVALPKLRNRFQLHLCFAHSYLPCHRATVITRSVASLANLTSRGQIDCSSDRM